MENINELPPKAPSKCLNCSKILKGRKDKKFCDTSCRNTHNNSLKTEKEAFVIEVNNILRKNWKILKTCNPQGKATVRKEYLLAQGYDFNYFTNIFKSQKNGNTYFFCYDMGITEVDNTHVCIVHWQKYMNNYKIPISLIDKE